MAAQYVVDASVLAHCLGTDTYTAEANALFAGLHRRDKLYIPELCLIECTNVVWKSVRFGQMSQTEAQLLINELVALPFEIILVRTMLPQALQIGLNYHLAVYDFLYIALALNLNCPVIIVDDRQDQAAIASGVIIKPITDFFATGSEAKE